MVQEYWRTNWLSQHEGNVSAFRLINFLPPFPEAVLKDLEVGMLGEDQNGEKRCRYHLRMWIGFRRVGLGCWQCRLCTG